MYVVDSLEHINTVILYINTNNSIYFDRVLHETLKQGKLNEK